MRVLSFRRTNYKMARKQIHTHAYLYIERGCCLYNRYCAAISVDKILGEILSHGDARGARGVI